MVIGPAGATASEDTLAELIALQTQIDSIETVLAESYTLTTAQRNSFNDLVAQIEDEITLRTAIVTISTTMEVVIEPGPVARAQVITAARVVNLDFSFNNSFATATPAMILADVVARTAFALRLNEETLASGAKIVPFFSGITVPASILPTAPPVLPPIVAATNTIPEVAGRTNIQSVTIGGSVPDYTITAEVVYGAEPSFEQATITKLYSFRRPASAGELSPALRDLVTKGKAKISEDFGVTQSYLDTTAVISIERYEDRDSVPTTVRTTSISGRDVEAVSVTLDDSPITYFGSYSVIEEVRLNTNVVVGAPRGEAFSVSFQSDQDELVTFSLAPEYRLVSGGRDDDDYYSPTGRLQYGFVYSIHGVPIEYITEGDVTYQGFVDYLEQYFAGIGELFELTDQEFIAEFSDFLANNGSSYEIRGRSFSDVDWTVVEADACYAEREKNITKGVISYMLEGMQFTDDVLDITYVYPDIEIYVDGERGFFMPTKRCNTGSGFFPSLP